MLDYSAMSKEDLILFYEQDTDDEAAQDVITDILRERCTDEEWGEINRRVIHRTCRLQAAAMASMGRSEVEIRREIIDMAKEEGIGNGGDDYSNERDMLNIQRAIEEGLARSFPRDS